MCRSEQLQKIIALSREMLEKARALEWERVAELEVQRKQLVSSCFRHPAHEQEVPAVADGIRQILRINDEITTLGRECKTRLSGELHTQKLGRTASAAYRDCAR